jgi:hypothetical protein
MSKKKKAIVDRATARVGETKSTPEEMVTQGTAAAGRVLASQNIGSASDVKATATAWNASLILLQTNNTNKAKARADLDLALSNEPSLVRDCNLNKRQMLAAIDVFSKGSKDTVKSFNVEVEARQTRPEATVPANLRAMKVVMPTHARVRWDPTLGAEGYMVQHATNTADPSTYAAPVRTTGARYDLGGQTAGTTVYFRVAALDTALPGGQTAFSAWVAVVITA